MKNKLVFTFVFIVCSIFANAQNALSKIEKEYSLTSDKTIERLVLAPKYANALFLQNLKTKSYYVLETNIQFAIKQKNGQYATVLYAVQAMNYRLDNKKTESEKSLSLAKKYALKTSNNEAKGYLKYAEGWIMIRNNKTTDAVDALLKAIDYYENSPTTSTLYARFANVVKELAAIYANMGEYQLEEKYSKQFLLLTSKQNDPNLIFDAYMRMGYMYEQKYIQNPSDNVLKSKVEHYYLRAIMTFDKNQDAMLDKSKLSYAAINLANHYIGLDRVKALKYAELANEVSVETANAVHIASSLGILSELAMEDENYGLATSYLLQATIEIRKSPVKDPNIELSLLASLSEISERQGKFSEALSYYKQYVAKYQTIYDQEKLNITKRLESQFEQERQEQKYIKLQLEDDRKAQQIKLMDILRKQQQQVYSNLKLVEENQRERLKFSELQSEKQAQQLRLSKLETAQKNKDVSYYKDLLAYKEKINAYYITFMGIFVFLILVLLYAYKQRAKSLKRRDQLHYLALEQEKQYAKIATLTALLEGQELERDRIARDLHDGLGGLLSRTKLQLTQVGISSENKSEEIDKSMEQLDDAIDELRRVAHNLMPDLLVKYGLKVAVETFATRMAQPSLDIHTEFIRYEDSLTQDKQLILYRIIQELVNNCIKHANASEIIIQLSEQENMITLIVEDNGNGLEPKKLNLSKTAGFHNIESRVQFLKGTINIESDPNMGTSIEIQIPNHIS